MSRTTTVRQFLGSVSETLQDLAPQYFRWGERELVVYANYAQRSIAKYLPQAGMRTDAIKLATGTRQDLTLIPAARILPGDGSAAEDAYGIALHDIVRNMGTNGSTPGRMVHVVDRRAKDLDDPNWHTRTGTAVREFMYDKATPRTFYVAPGVTGDVWLEVSWMAEPPRIPAGGAPGSELYVFAGSNGTLMGVHDQYIEDAHNYVVAVALLKGSKNVVNLPKSQHHASLFVASLNAQGAAVSGTSPNLKTLPMIDQIPGAA